MSSAFAASDIACFVHTYMFECVTRCRYGNVLKKIINKIRYALQMMLFFIWSVKFYNSIRIDTNARLRTIGGGGAVRPFDTYTPDVHFERINKRYLLWYFFLFSRCGALVTIKTSVQCIRASVWKYLSRRDASAYIRLRHDFAFWKPFVRKETYVLQKSLAANHRAVKDV